jgi:hypothetical protein
VETARKHEFLFPQQCIAVRCQADQKKSGLSWDNWKIAKAKEISADIVNRTKELLKAAGKTSFDTGIYNVSPEHIYDVQWRAIQRSDY